MAFGVVLCLGLLVLLWWGTGGDDIAHAVVTTVCIFLLGGSISFAAAGVLVNHPYRIEEHFQDYCANEFCYKALAEELERLKTGIADYNRQYEEQKEYIWKFAALSPMVKGYGSLTLVLKADDFHAQLEVVTATDKVSCRLEFGEDDYKHLASVVEFFNGKSCLAS